MKELTQGSSEHSLTQENDHAPLNRKVFARNIAELEAAKQQNIAGNTLDVWYKTFAGMGWTNLKFKQRVLAVMGMAQVRTLITLDDFLHAPPFKYVDELHSDAMRLALQIIAKRKADYAALRVSEEAVREAGLVALEEIYSAELEHKKDEWLAKETGRYKQLRAVIARMDPAQIIGLYHAGLKNKLIEEAGGLIEGNTEYLKTYLRAKVTALADLIQSSLPTKK